MDTFGMTRLTMRSQHSEQYATNERTYWEPEDDDRLFDGTPETQLAFELGRSIRAVQRRKWRLRQMDIMNFFTVWGGSLLDASGQPREEYYDRQWCNWETR
jgi:hypothetical protein